MPNTKQQNYQPVTFDSIKIGLASPEIIGPREDGGYRSGVSLVASEPHSRV